MIIAIIGIISTISVPLYRSYQLRSHLETAKNQVVQGLQRAKQNAQSGKNDAVWSFYPSAGVLFQGSSYATHDPAKAEIYPMPTTIEMTGLTQVTYDKRGFPDVTGDIILQQIGTPPNAASVKIVVDRQKISVFQVNP